ncbi:hypothetical protein LZ31DRAFT_220935 [Colletotrichum somersetense]|nr:hypothetical protein LZ31DRAFT_220935 [Colletotrichum somersetense]
MICQVTKVGATLSASSTKGETFSIEHLRIDDDHSHQAIWFAGCAMILYAHSPTPILDYRVPDNIRRLAKAEIIPHDVMDALYGNGVEEIPLRVTTRYLFEWECRGRKRDKPEHQQQITLRDIFHDHNFDFYVDRMQKMLSTPPQKGPELERASISWLRAQGQILCGKSKEDTIKAVLSRMVTDRDFSRSLGQMLENWCEWARRGAMYLADFCNIYQDKATFARAILLIVTLSEI